VHRSDVRARLGRLGLGLLVLGHIYFAIKDAEARRGRRGMRTGHVSTGWDELENAEWVEGEPGPNGDRANRRRDT
jgi:formate dehydrogenase subunit gamma